MLVLKSNLAFSAPGFHWCIPLAASGTMPSSWMSKRVGKLLHLLIMVYTVYMASESYTSPAQDKVLQTEQITPELINYIVEKIVAAMAPLKIVLFGSAAAGQWQADSDLDFLIIHDNPVSNRQVRRQIEYLLWGRRFGVDLIVRRPDEVAMNMSDNNPLYTDHILGKGRVLYERARETAG